MNYSELTEVKPYPAYKTSQIPWIGEIPEHWEVSHLRYFCECLDGRRIPLSAENRGDKQGNIPYWGANSVIDHINGWIFDEPLVLVGEDGAPFTDTTRSVAFFVNEKVWVNNHIHVLRCSKELRPEFLVHILNSVDYKDFISGSTRDKLTQQRLLDIPIQLAPPTEQAAIVRFLDHADEQIKRYIASKERLIALLEEERQALVHQAVTRGLDPNVKLKPSGVEWLGDVPEHWSIRTLGQIADSFRTGPFGSMLHQSDYIEGGIPVINPIHIRGGVIAEDPSCSVSDPVAVRLSDYRLAKHDLVFSRRGELGRCSLVRDRETNWLCGTGSIRVRITYDGIDPEFVIQALQVQWVGEYLSHVSVGATMNNLNTGILKSIPILMPPLQEQGNILGHSTRQTSAIDVAMTSIRQMIGLLQEYRTRLIADVVTGQLDVREAAEELPTPEPTEITD